MFDECLEIRRKTASLISSTKIILLEVISSIRHSVSSPDETLHLMLDILREK